MKVTRKQKPVTTQERVPERITAKGALSDILQSVGGFVASPVRAAWNLLRRPGETARRYILGDRDGLLNPAGFAAWGATVFLALNYKFASEIGAFFDPFAVLRIWWPYVGMLVLAPVAALQKRIFRASGFNWAETFSFGLYMLGQLALFHSAVITFEHFSGVRIPWLAILALESLYVAWAATGLYHDRSARTWLKGWLIFATYCALGYGLVMLFQIWRFSGMFG